MIKTPLLKFFIKVIFLLIKILNQAQPNPLPTVCDINGKCEDKIYGFDVFSYKKYIKK